MRLSLREEVVVRREEVVVRREEVVVRREEVREVQVMQMVMVVEMEEE